MSRALRLLSEKAHRGAARERRVRAPAGFAEHVPAGAREIARQLAEAGYPTYLVGGSVRDLLLGRTARDWDIATAARPAEVASVLDRVTPVAADLGTVLAHGAADDPFSPYDVTTFRREGPYPDRRRPAHVVFTTDVGEDLVRRDFTVNALAYDPVEGTILDVAGGLRDLAKRKLVTVGDPVTRFSEDALRLLRAVRLACELGFTLDRSLRAAIPPLAGLAAGLAAERVRDELLRMLALPKPSVAFELLAETGLLAVVLPELDLTRDVGQNRFHAYDVFYHTLYTMDAAPADKPLVRLAALFHDMGKPATRVIRDADATFYDHQYVGAELAERVLARLRVGRADRERVKHLVAQHMFGYSRTWTDAAVRRFVRRVGPDALADLFDLRLADYVGNGLAAGFPTDLDELRARIDREIAGRAPVGRGDLAIDGRDVMATLGVAPGPPVREALDRLLEMVLDAPEKNTRARLLAELRAWRAAGVLPQER